MAGSATITGRQNYVLGIGHPRTTPADESAPAIYENVYGGDGSGLQDAINATPEYGVLKLLEGRYEITDQIVINKSMRLYGDGVMAMHDPLSSGIGQFDTPGKAPHLTGTVIVQKTAAKDAIKITASAAQVDLQDFGILFEGAHRFTNTGHGITSEPAAYGSGSDHGLMHSKWSNIQVFGHDGNHYAFKAINTLHCTTHKLRAYGGGGIYWHCDSYAGNYGNTTHDSPFVHLFCGGTAHGYFVHGRTIGTTAGMMNLMTFIRPQVNTTDQTARYGVAATSSQYLFKAINGAGTSCNNLTVIGPDFETVVGSPCDFGFGAKFIDPSGIFGGSGDATSKEFQVMRSTTGAKVLNSNMTIEGKNATPAPTVAIGAAAGTGATVSISGDDEVGTITMTSGTSPGTFGVLFTVTFGAFDGSAFVELSPRNGNAGKVNTYISNRTATGWVANIAATAVDPSVSLIWDYYVKQ